MNQPFIFALAGNQNCGKTTLFNQLTGSNQHVGNFPGVTVASKSGILKGKRQASVVDLPGIYSLSPYTNEEIVTRDFLLQKKPDCLINIVDATNIERNLYLTLQLIELDIPMVLAFNMMDEVRANGGTIQMDLFREGLGIPVAPIAASKNEGVEELMELAMDVAKRQAKPNKKDFCAGAVHRAIHSVAHIVEDHAQRIHIPSRFAATKLLEGDEPMLQALELSENEKEMITHSVKEMEKDLDTDRESALVDMRYQFIDTLCKEAVIKPGFSKEYLRSVKIDGILTHKYLAIPLFFCILALIFWLTFGVIGAWLSEMLSSAISGVTETVSQVLQLWKINPVMHSLVIDGIFAGVGSVLSFLPIIVVLFFFLSLLEDSGYMARVAFVMDRLLRRIGLSGRSFVPMLIGFGCSVPAILSARTLSSERDHKMTVLLIPFMSCSAKVPIYAVFTAAFFPRQGVLVMILLYFLGILIGTTAGVILNRFIFPGKPVPFVMELPNYRLPSIKSVMLLIWEKAKDFITRAFTVIFVATIVIWFLQHFDIRFNVVTHSQDSILAYIGRMAAPIFAPLGFGSWQAATALITGFTAKEAVISTLAVLTATSTTTLPQALSSLFYPASAGAFLVFTLLYTPCVAAVAAAKKELKSIWATCFILFGQTCIAWFVAFFVFHASLAFLAMR